MIHLVKFMLTLGCIHLSQYSVQANIFRCNATSACGCSRFNADINARIVGGEVAVSHSWGWAVSLRNYRESSICGGTIISQYYVLTAAHCVEDFAHSPAMYSIVVGIDTIYSTQGQQRYLSRIFIHPKYNSKTKENDIAILYLTTPIDLLDANVAKICLPAIKQSEQSRYPVVKRPIVAIGWGTTTSDGVASPNLRQVTVHTVENDDRTCTPSINNANLQFCAAVNGGGKDTCQGDSGGPIMHYSQQDQVWVLAGITSYGRGCALPNYAGVYTRASAYINWIQSIAGNDGIMTISQSNASLHRLSNLMIITAIIFSIVTPIYNFIG